MKAILIPTVPVLTSCLKFLRGSDTLSGEASLFNFCPFLKRVYSKRKNSLKGFGAQEGK